MKDWYDEYDGDNGTALTDNSNVQNTSGTVNNKYPPAGGYLLFIILRCYAVILFEQL